MLGNCFFIYRGEYTEGPVWEGGKGGGGCPARSGRQLGWTSGRGNQGQKRSVAVIATGCKPPEPLADLPPSAQSGANGSGDTACRVLGAVQTGVPCEGSEARALEFGVEVAEEICEGAFVGEIPVGITGHLAAVGAVAFDGERAAGPSFGNGQAALNHRLELDIPHAGGEPGPELLNVRARAVAAPFREGVAAAGERFGEKLAGFVLHGLAGG